MKISCVKPKFFSVFSKQKPIIKSIQKEPMPPYNPNDATVEEFRAYVHYLAKNNINRTFYEPKKLVTLEEREANRKKEEGLKPFKEFVHNLAKNNINRTFYC